MKAMTLLRAMSAIDPKDIEAAFRAAGLKNAYTVFSPGLTAEDTETAEIPVPYPKPLSAGKRYAIGGWAAAAACIALVAAAGLYFRSNDNYLTTPSGSEWVIEITETAPAETVPTQGADVSTAGYAETGAVTAVAAAGTAVTETQTAGAEADSPEAVTAPPETDHGIPTTTVTAPVTEITTTTTAAEPRVSMTEVPALLATSDGSSTIENDAGETPRVYELGELSTTEILYDAAEIRAFLERSDPPVTLGTGRITADDYAAVLADPVMIHIRWQAPDDRWTAYSLQRADLNSDGNLSIQAAVYTDSLPEHNETWVYEIALLCRRSDLPEIRSVSFERLNTFADNDETGIENYMRFWDSLSDDICIHIID